MRTDLELSEEMTRYVQSCLATGKYESIDALVEAALREKLSYEAVLENDFSIENARWEEYQRTGKAIPHKQVMARINNEIATLSSKLHKS